MKKCLVLDLDNTLWGGVVGEDGMENLALSLQPPGNGFLAFQQAIMDHFDRGVILAINSRNNPDDAWQVIRTHPNMILREKHFAAARINWNDKVDNLKELARELNIGLDSMVFLDDDETNRAAVRAMLPEVLTPDLPKDPAEYARFLNSLGVFDSSFITDEDKMRGNLYVTERLRKEEEKKFVSKEDFLKSLSLELEVFCDDDSCLPRLSQLTEKTNQFNTMKKPLTEGDLRRYIESPDHHVFFGKLSDKFGDYGIIAFALTDKSKDSWRISSMLLSCRAFVRGVEDAFFAVIRKQALKEKISKISIAFEETPKNAPAKEFVEKNFKNKETKINKSPHSPSWIKTIYE